MVKDGNSDSFRRIETRLKRIKHSLSKWGKLRGAADSGILDVKLTRETDRNFMKTDGSREGLYAAV